MTSAARTNRNQAALLPRLLAGLVALAALAGLLTLGWVIARRITYPYDLEWMEGGMLCHALRLLHGQPIYAAPSVDFIPHLYTPLYPMVVAALGAVAGDVSYVLGRGVSTAALCGALLLAGAWAYKEGGSRAAALWAMALPAVTFAQTGGFFDLARADSLQLFLTALGAAAAFYGRGRHLAMAAAALLLVAGFFAKQTAAPLIVFVASAMLLTRRRTVLTFAVVGVASFALCVYLQNRASQGWFWTYIFRLHQSHAFFYQRAFLHTPRALVTLLGPALGVAAWAGLAQALGKSSEQPGPGLYYLLWLGLGGIVTACISFGTQWAHTNALIPGIYFPAIAIGAAAGRLVTRHARLPRAQGPISAQSPSGPLPPDSPPSPSGQPPRSGRPSMGSGRQRRARTLRESLVWLALLASLFARGRELRPAAHVPTLADRAAGDAVIALLRSAPGEVLVPFHPFYAHLAGKRTYLHRMGIWDVRGTAAGPVHGLFAALQQKQFARIIFDDKIEATWGDWPEVLTSYRISDRILGPRTFEGAQTAPALVLEPRPAPPPEPSVAPAASSAPQQDSARQPPGPQIPIDRELQ